MNAESYVKEAFQKLFMNPDKQKEIFDVIWGNESLRGKLFVNIDFMEDNAEKESFKLFNDKILNTKDQFYSFIKVK